MNKSTQEPKSETKSGIYLSIFLFIVSPMLNSPISRILGAIIQATAKAIIAEFEIFFNWIK